MKGHLKKGMICSRLKLVTKVGVHPITPETLSPHTAIVEHLSSEDAWVHADNLRTLQDRYELEVGHVLIGQSGRALRHRRLQFNRP